MGAGLDSFNFQLFCGQSTCQRSNIVRASCFKRITAKKLTVKSVICGKFSVLWLVRVIKPFVGEEVFCFWIFVCFQERIKTCCSTWKIHFHFGTTLIHVNTSGLLPSLMTFFGFFQDAAQFNPNCCLDVKEKIWFLLYFATLDFPVLQWKVKRGDEDQRCGGELVRPQSLKKWIFKSVQAFPSTLLSVYLWRSHPGHKLFQNWTLLIFWRVFVDLCSWYRNSPACRREILGFDIRSSDRYF